MSTKASRQGAGHGSLVQDPSKAAHSGGQPGGVARAVALSGKGRQSTAWGNRGARRVTEAGDTAAGDSGIGYRREVRSSGAGSTSAGWSVLRRQVQCGVARRGCSGAAAKKTPRWVNH